MKAKVSSRFGQAVLLLALILSGAGCIPNRLSQLRSQTPTPIPVLTFTPAPVPSPQPESTATVEPEPVEAGVLYQDDFTDINSGWPNGLVFDNYFIGYHEPDYYHVQVGAPNDSALVVLPGQSFDNVTAEVELFVDPANTASEGDFRYGLALRRSGKQYYAFTVSPRNKIWYIVKYAPDRSTVLSAGSVETLQGLVGPDTLRVDADGPNLTFYINGQQVGQVSDADYAGGEAGFYVETFDSSRVHIHYDTLAISTVKPPPLPQGEALYQDDFTDINSGWPNGLVFDNYFIGYHEPDYYHVQVGAPNDSALVVLPGQSFDNVTAEVELFVDPANTASEGDFRYGLALRRSGKQYYAFTVSPRNQHWAVLKSASAGLAVLAEGMVGTLQGLSGPDTLRVDADGPNLTFYINGQQVGQVSDADYAGGEAGFYVETFDSPRVHIHYDTLAIWKGPVPGDSQSDTIPSQN